MSFQKPCRIDVFGGKFVTSEGLKIPGLVLSIPEPIDSPLQSITKRNQELIGFGDDHVDTLVGGWRNHFFIDSMVACAYFKSARVHFFIRPQAMNESKWSTAT